MKYENVLWLSVASWKFDIQFATPKNLVNFTKLGSIQIINNQVIMNHSFIIINVKLKTIYKVNNPSKYHPRRDRRRRII